MIYIYDDNYCEITKKIKGLEVVSDEKYEKWLERIFSKNLGSNFTMSDITSLYGGFTHPNCIIRVLEVYDEYKGNSQFGCTYVCDAIITNKDDVLDDQIKSIKKDIERKSKEIINVNYKIDSHVAAIRAIIALNKYWADLYESKIVDAAIKDMIDTWLSDTYWEALGCKK